MFKNKPLTLVIASALMIVLVVVTLVFQFVGGAGQIGMAGNRPGGGQGGFTPGQMPEGATLPDGSQPPSGGQRPSGGGDNFQTGDGTAPSGDFQAPSGGQLTNFNGSSTTMKLMQLLRGVQMGAAILIAVLGLLSAVGMFLVKKWGRTWAIVTSILVLVTLIPSLFQRFMGSSVLEMLLKLALAVAVIVLCSLPKSRQPVVQA